MNNPVLDFTGQSAIVTGGATGIGESCAPLFARRRATVTVMDIDVQGAESVTTAIREEGGNAYLSAVDLTDWEATRAAVQESHRRSGPVTLVPTSRRGVLCHYDQTVTKGLDEFISYIHENCDQESQLS